MHFYEILQILKKPNELNLEKLIIFTNFLRKYKNIKIGITTGCFDIFHSGHLESINYAKNNCDILILLLNLIYQLKN